MTIRPKVRWTDLRHFMDWLLSGLIPVTLPPGETGVHYFDVADNSVLLALRIPDLSMQTNR
jgi:hypothetical protein